jgi:hypothetical protein
VTGWRGAALLTTVLIVGGAEAGAQTCDADGYRPSAGACAIGPIPISVTIGKVAEVTVSSASTALPTPTNADFDAGIIAAPGPTVSVRANTPWSLQIGATTAVWTAAASAPGQSPRADKPASDLLWATAVGGTFRPLALGSTLVRAGSATAGTATALFYRALLAWDADPPGDYAIVVSLTLVTP